MHNAHDALVLLSINQHTKFEVRSFPHSRNITGATENLKWVTWPDQWPRPFQGS